MTDLVLPVPGFQIKYPLNEISDYIKSLLDLDGLIIEDFSNQDMNFNSTGYYRKVVERPKNVEYAIVRHDNPDEDLQNEHYNVEEHPKPIGDTHKSLRIQFQLPQSTYATMLFRELTKTSSAVNVQANLSKKYNK